MTQQSSADSTNGPQDATSRPPEMQQADTANGENPDDLDDSASSATKAAAAPPSHPTGERQAQVNAENEPPA